jgi:hypothetical protein
VQTRWGTRGGSTFGGTDREDAEHTYEGLIRSFEWLGGVTADVLVDNQKCAVLEHRADGPRFNPRFLDLAGHYREIEIRNPSFHPCPRLSRPDQHVVAADNQLHRQSQRRQRRVRPDWDWP